MPQVIMAAAEGEHALFSNTLSTLGNDDNKHRGSVVASPGDALFYRMTDAQVSDDMWFHTLMAYGPTAVGVTDSGTFMAIYNDSDQFMAGWRDAYLNFASSARFQARYSSSKAAGDDLTTGLSYEFPLGEFFDIDIRMRITTVTNANDTLTIDYYVSQQLRTTQVVTDATGWERPQRVIHTALATGVQRPGYYQDIIITDGVPTVGMELVTMAPAASGTYTAFTNNYTNIDELGYDSDDLIFATAAAQRESWICATPTFDTSDKVIYAFVANQVVQTDLGAVVTDFKPFVRIAATDYDGSALLANNLSPLSLIHVWTQNPNTTAPWVESDFDGLEVGLLTT